MAHFNHLPPEGSIWKRPVYWEKWFNIKTEEEFYCEKCKKELLGGPVAKTLCSQDKGTWVWSLVWELDPTCHNWECECRKQRSHVPQWRLKVPCAATKTQHSQINTCKYFSKVQKDENSVKALHKNNATQSTHMTVCASQLPSSAPKTLYWSMRVVWVSIMRKYKNQQDQVQEEATWLCRIEPNVKIHVQQELIYSLTILTKLMGVFKEFLFFKRRNDLQ